MKAQNLIAIAAAVLITSASLFTTASLSGASFNGDSQQQAPSEINGKKVINLAPIVVHPSADERRAAVLLTDIGVAGLATMPMLGHASVGTEQSSLVRSQLAMPYYSFSNKFGRISKE
jgi:hypothetical protein